MTAAGNPPTVPLFTPSQERAASTALTAFTRRAEGASGRSLPDYQALHTWSIEEPGAFWSEVWSFCDLIGQRGEIAVADASRMPGARWFPQARLNFAENLLRRRDDTAALIFQGEEQVRREISFGALHETVSRAARALRALEVEPGDRVAGLLPNVPEAIVAMLAAASLGAIWSGCSPDFGVRGVLDRFEQIEPRVLFATDSYFYSGKRIDCLGRLAEIARALPSLERIVVVPYGPERPEIGSIPGALLFDDFVAQQRGGEIEFAQLPFDHPLYLLFSSGTTGRPKCIVHGAGGTLLQHVKEHRLHVNLGREDRLFYFTTCGWMMWNWLASGLASGATLLLYDGSPLAREGRVLFELAERERISIFGASAKFIDSVAKLGLRPREQHDLSSIHTLLSTGSPLAPEGFDFVYDAIGSDLHLASISGGTDIISCFVLGNPTAPVWRGEIQARGLGMAVAVYEVLDPVGRPVPAGSGEPGELVCTAPFPSMPIGFWNDPKGAMYEAAYFRRFPGVWCHGDLIRETDHGGFVISGRSDAVLNPGGVRIGTAEIYRHVEQLPEVIESLAIGQEWQGDTRVVLFVMLRAGALLDDDLRERIRSIVRTNATPRHVPARIVSVPDIPRTRSGKITELAVRDVVHGHEVTNLEALANPEALEHFRNRPELEA